MNIGLFKTGTVEWIRIKESERFVVNIYLSFKYACSSMCIIGLFSFHFRLVVVVPDIKRVVNTFISEILSIFKKTSTNTPKFSSFNFFLNLNVDLFTTINF